MKNLSSLLGTLFYAVLVLGILFVITLVAGVGIVLVGRVLTLVAELSAFEASLIALGVALTVLGGLGLILRALPILSASPFGEDNADADLFDEEEDEDEEILPPANRNDPCPCGSGCKYKNCHGR